MVRTEGPSPIFPRRLSALEKLKEGGDNEHLHLSFRDSSSMVFEVPCPQKVFLWHSSIYARRGTIKAWIKMELLHYLNNSKSVLMKKLHFTSKII